MVMYTSMIVKKTQMYLNFVVLLYTLTSKASHWLRDKQPGVLTVVIHKYVVKCMDNYSATCKNKILQCFQSGCTNSSTLLMVTVLGF